MSTKTLQKFQIKYLKTSSLIPYVRNAKLHDDEQVSAIAGSIREFGFTNPVLVDDENIIIAGHGRVLAAQRLGLKEVPCLQLSHLDETQRKAYRLADNKLAEIGGGWDTAMLNLELEDLVKNLGVSPALMGFSEEEIEQLEAAAKHTDFTKSGALAERFLASPFSVFDARAGWWLQRKEEWLALGLASEKGRGEELIYRSRTLKNFGHPQGTSIFDPVLCELLYRWFTSEGASILDPFAGGSVRGVVASMLGRNYTGIDLRPEQVEANENQRGLLCKEGSPQPQWIVGDSRNIRSITNNSEFDFIFSCPPYADLEQYSDDPADLSTLEYPEFIDAYREIIKASVALLRNNRFACFVVGDIRDKNGHYRNFISDTITAFQDSGLHLYNEAVLVTMIGSLPLRVGKQFETSRKLGKAHQNVLIFIKGDAKEATRFCGTVETSLDIDQDE